MYGVHINCQFGPIIIWWGPAQDTPFALIIWYTAKKKSYPVIIKPLLD